MTISQWIDKQIDEQYFVRLLCFVLSVIVGMYTTIPSEPKAEVLCKLSLKLKFSPVFL